MKKRTIILATIISIFSLGNTQILAKAQDIQLPKQIGTINVDKPAFLFLEKGENQTNLVETSFGVFGGNAVRQIEGIDKKLSNKNLQFDDITTNVTWPNYAESIPDTYLGKDLMVVAGGFLTPGNSTGAISIVEKKTGKIHEVSTPKSNWFYHKALWKDMNNDGKMDIVTARAKKSLLGSDGELLWLENKGDYNSKWTEHVIAKGPDVNFEIRDLDNDGTDEIITAGFFSKKISVFWKDGQNYKEKVIDDTIGSAFDISFTDINNDGTVDMLATNHESKGSVYAYEIPKDFKKDTWKRHTLLSGIKTLQSGIGQASPGQAIAFKPSKDYSGKPYIAVAGDGSQKAHLLIPNNNSSNDWNYTEKIILDAGCTVGQLAIGDVNNDGYTEIFIPAYDNNKVYIYSFK